MLKLVFFVSVALVYVSAAPSGNWHEPPPLHSVSYEHVHGVAEVGKVIEHVPTGVSHSSSSVVHQTAAHITPIVAPISSVAVQQHIVPATAHHVTYERVHGVAEVGQIVEHVPTSVSHSSSSVVHSHADIVQPIIAPVIHKAIDASTLAATVPAPAAFVHPHQLHHNTIVETAHPAATHVTYEHVGHGFEEVGKIVEHVPTSVSHSSSSVVHSHAAVVQPIVAPIVRQDAVPVSVVVEPLHQHHNSIVENAHSAETYISYEHVGHGVAQVAKTVEHLPTSVLHSSSAAVDPHHHNTIVETALPTHVTYEHVGHGVVEVGKTVEHIPTGVSHSSSNVVHSHAAIVEPIVQEHVDIPAIIHTADAPTTHLSYENHNVHSTHIANHRPELTTPLVHAHTVPTHVTYDRVHCIAEVGKVVEHVPTSVSHSSSSVVHDHATIVQPIVASVRQTVIAEEVAAPIVHAAATVPTHVTYERVHGVAEVGTIVEHVPTSVSHSSSSVVHSHDAVVTPIVAPIQKTIAAHHHYDGVQHW